MKYILTLFVVIGSMFAFGFSNASAAEEVEGTPIVEETEGLTEEEVQALIDDAYSLVLGFWDKFVAGASITSIFGALLVFYMNTKRTEKLTKRNDLLIGAVQALQIFTGEMAKEERDLKNAIVSMITVANIDGMVKKQLLEQLNNSSIDMNKIQETIDALQAAKVALDKDEVESLLNKDV